MTLKKHFYPLNMLLLLLTLGVGCSNDKASKEVPVQIEESPPSVSGMPEGKLIIQLSDKEKDELQIETARVSSNIQNYRLQVPGVVFPASGYVSIISTPLDGRVSAVMIRDGDPVRKGQELFKIESLVFGNLVAEYLQGLAEERFQTTRLERLKQLVEQTISSKAELDRAMSDYQRASAASIAAFAKLKAIGVPDHEIEALKSAENIDPSLKIHAPIGGKFDQRMVELGQSVNALEKLGRIIDTDKVLIKGYLSPEDARSIQMGDSVRIGRRDNDQLGIAAVVSSVNPGLDEENRSVVVNVEVHPEDGWPKPGETVRMEIATRSLGEVFAVPLKAVTYDGNQAVVFVKKDESTYEKRGIEITEIQDQFAIVNEGMQEEEEVAISQVFSLKALSRFEMIAEE
ncbi:efflux RND transporter periplasmic adaptor subunit [uncultured Sunxiuqinia sp.]|uniref:efflux RND transporter periplasmic adaptor subunit n=1 Tax=uncultured Sunxiuqinia sp. TaxID=1573825 RepID=UPI002612DF81|nr:efflux RND transporter periplasmic adaptor subunit [uncultured Sunxiuqinia sp.]